MKNATKRTAVLLSTAGLLAGSAVLPLPATAAMPECEPGDVRTVFVPGSVAPGMGAPLESATLTNSATETSAVPAARMAAATSSAEVSESVSLPDVLATLKSDAGIDAFESQSWDAGQKIGALTLPAGNSMDVTYGFTEVSFTGTQESCQLDGRFGAETSFSGTAPTGEYVSYADPISNP